jgi:hypothetical protein
MSDRKMRTGEAIRYLKAGGYEISDVTLQRWCRDGKMPHGRTLGGRYLLDPSDLDGVLRDNGLTPPDWTPQPPTRVGQPRKLVEVFDDDKRGASDA